MNNAPCIALFHYPPCKLSRHIYTIISIRLSEKTLASGSSPCQMLRFTLILFSLLLFAVPATTKSIASSVATTSKDNNAKLHTSSTLTGIISTVAGFRTRSAGGTTDGISATSARIEDPRGLAIDKEGNIIFADYDADKIRKVLATTGIITTVAGTGDAGFFGDGGQATSAMLNTPNGIGLDTAGNLFIADTDNNRIRKVTVSTGIITTVAGNDKTDYTGDNVAATSTSLKFPHDVAIDTNGNIYIADTGNFRIRKVTVSTGIMTTIAGSGVPSDKIIGPTTAATDFHLYSPIGVTLDTSGNIYIAGGSNDPCVFKVIASNGYISIVAGTGPSLGGEKGYNGDGILATTARLNVPRKVAFDSLGNMFISETESERIRKVTASTGMITTAAGTGNIGREPYDGEGSNALLASIHSPIGLAVDAAGNFYFSSYLGVVRKVTYTAVTPSSSMTSAPSTAVASAPSAPSPSSSSARTSTAPATAPATASSAGSQSSATTHTTKTVHSTLVLLTTMLLLHLCRGA